MASIKKTVDNITKGRFAFAGFLSGCGPRHANLMIFRHICVSQRKRQKWSPRRNRQIEFIICFFYVVWAHHFVLTTTPTYKIKNERKTQKKCSPFHSENILHYNSTLVALSSPTQNLGCMALLNLILGIFFLFFYFLLYPLCSLLPWWMNELNIVYNFNNFFLSF